MRAVSHFLLLLVVASCGGSNANHFEVAQLRADVAAMETRLQEAEAKQLEADDAAPTGAPSPAPDVSRELAVVEIFSGIVERVCACEDMECVEGEIKALEALKDEDEPGPEAKKVIMVEAEKLTGCITRLATAAADDAVGTP